MKKIRLEIPLRSGEVYIPKKVWLKVNGNKTEAFEDMNFTRPIPETGKKVSIEVKVPKQLQSIEIVVTDGNSPEEGISRGWSMQEAINPNWKVPGLKNVTIIFDDRTHEVPLKKCRPDRQEWDYYRNFETGGSLFCKRWALAVYTLESKTVGEFYLHSNLITGEK